MSFAGRQAIDMEKKQEKRIARYRKYVDELEAKHNHSIYREIWQRNIKHSERIALSYQEREWTYAQLFESVDIFANALLAMGFKRGDEIPVCISNTPEFVYMILAISKIGAVINSFGNWFAKDYLVQIINETGSGVVFISDDNYALIEDAINESNVDRLVVFSLDDSLETRDGVKYNPFQAEQKKYLPTRYVLKKIRERSLKAVLSGTDVYQMGQGYQGESNVDVCLNDPFAITYTSGTTNPLRPKAVVHSVESYLLIGRFKDADVSGMGKMSNLRVLAHFPTYIHAGITTAIFDPLFESCTVVLSPIYSTEYFPKQIMNLKPNFVCASIAAWMSLAQVLESNSIKDSLSFLMIPCVTGEGMSDGEEKYLNYIAQKYKFGCDKLPWPMSPVSFSIGGGTSESSGVLVTLFKKHQRMKPEYWNGRKPVGLTPLNFAAVDVIHEDGSSCNVGELGTIALSSKCNMLGYRYTPELYKAITYTDSNGRQWLKMGAVGIKLDGFVHVQIKGRPTDRIVRKDGSSLWFFDIEHYLYEQVPELMSCSIVRDEKNDAIVVHVEKNPTAVMSESEFRDKCYAALNTFALNECLLHLYLRVRTNSEGFPAAVSGKRDFGMLISEGIQYAERVQ